MRKAVRFSQIISCSCLISSGIECFFDAIHSKSSACLTHLLPDLAKANAIME